MSIPRKWSSDRAIQLAIERAPGKPHASDNFEKFGCQPLARDLALYRSNLQLNRDDTCSVLVFDVDHEFDFKTNTPHVGACWAWERHNLPPPSWVAINRENGHAHLAYVLDEPVLRLQEKRRKPVWLLGVIRRAMTEALGADRGYPNFMTKNPVNGNWLVFSFGCTYSLTELCDWIPDSFLEAAKSQTNMLFTADDAASCSSFPLAFRMAAPVLYSNWRKVAAEAEACGYSATLERLVREKLTNSVTGELLLKEDSFQKLVRDLTKWGAERFDEKKSRMLLSQRQSRRGKKSARLRRDRTGQLVIKAVEELQNAGMKVTKQAVAALVGRDRSVISRCYSHLLP